MLIDEVITEFSKMVGYQEIQGVFAFFIIIVIIYNIWKNFK
jgi:hypothetical protein